MYSIYTQYLLNIYSIFTQGVMKTVQDDCQFVCITQSDYYKILNDGEANQKVIKENDQVVLVSEFDNTTKTGFKVIRGTPEKLLDQLVDENFTAETKYDEDFLLTHRTFMPSFRGLFYLLKITQDLLKFTQYIFFSISNYSHGIFAQIDETGKTNGSSDSTTTVVGTQSFFRF